MPPSEKSRFVTAFDEFMSESNAHVFSFLVFTLVLGVMVITEKQIPQELIYLWTFLSGGATAGTGNRAAVRVIKELSNGNGPLYTNTKPAIVDDNETE